jgi:predicted nucleic acid-binding protein
MSVVFDSNVLIDFFTKKTSEDRLAKINDLVENLTKSRTKIIIPTPTLTEVLVHAGKGRDDIYNSLTKRTAIEIASFDI